MEIKKSPKADLEKGKGLNFLLGLVVALAIVYVALEYRTYDKIEAYTRDKVDIADMEETVLLEENVKNLREKLFALISLLIIFSFSLLIIFVSAPA